MDLRHYWAFGLLLLTLACGGSSNKGIGPVGGQPMAGAGGTTGATNPATATGGQSVGGQATTGLGGTSAVGGTPATNVGAMATGGQSVGGQVTSGSGGTLAVGGSLTSNGGAAGSGGQSVGGQTTSGLGGTSAVGGSSTSNGGTAASGGQSTGGKTTTGGSLSVGGTSTSSSGVNSGGSGGAGVGGLTSGGTTSAANDNLGQNPFSRPAGSGVLITSSDGLNATRLVLSADAHDGMFIAGATRNPQAMGLTAFGSGITSEAFAARLDAQGKLVWSVPLKGCGVPSDIASGSDESVYVLCPYEPDATTLMLSICESVALVDKLSSSDGHQVFQAQVKAPADPADGYWCPYGLGVDAQGRSYVGGAYIAVSPIEQVLLSAVTSTGQQDWTFISQGPTDTSHSFPNAYPNDVDVDSNGNVIFAGGFNNWMKLGTTQLTSQAAVGQDSMYNGFVGRISSSGTNATGWQFGGAIFDLGTTIKPASDGGFLVGGWVSGSATVGGTAVTASANGSAFIARLGSDGRASWAKALPDPSTTYGVAMASDGKAYFVGSFANNELLYTYDPAADKMISRTTIAGNATANDLQTNSIAVSTTGVVWIAGTFTGTINLGTGPLTTSSVSAFLWRVN